MKVDKIEAFINAILRKTMNSELQWTEESYMLHNDVQHKLLPGSTICSPAYSSRVESKTFMLYVILKDNNRTFHLKIYEGSNAVYDFGDIVQVRDLYNIIYAKRNQGLDDFIDRFINN